MEKRINIPKCDSCFLTSSGKTIQTREDITPYNDPDWFKKNYKETFQSKFKFFRKMYGLSCKELGELVGVSEKAIQNLERPEESIRKSNERKQEKIADMIARGETPPKNTKTNLQSTDSPALDIAIKCAKIYSSIPTKEGKYYRVSIDNIVGLTPFSSVTNELISSETGLSNEAIEKLRSYNQTDNILKSINRQQMIKGNPSLSYAVFNYRMPVINFILSHPKLLSMINAFWRMAFPSDFCVPVYEDKGKLKKIPYSEKFEGHILLANGDSLNDNIPLDITPDFNHSVAATQIAGLTENLSTEFYEDINNNPDRYARSLL